MTAADEDYGRRERLLLHHHPPTSASPAQPHADRYIPPPAPAPGERYCDRYLPSPSPGERYLSPPGDRYIPPPAPADRYLPPASAGAAAPGGPGDPYMRRDLGYHHHYRLPAPSFHPHHHQYYHHQRTLPQAPQHHRPLSYHPHTPSRGHIRCCPSPSHYEQPYLVPAAGSPGGSSSSGSSNAAPTSTPSVVTSRDYGTSPSPLLPHRGRTPPCNVSQRLLPPQQPSSPSAAGAPQQNPIVEYVGASGGRHVSTPTPPPATAVALPRCSSMSSCDVGVENPLCEHHPRRGCSGVLDPLEQGSTVSLCCGAGRRFAAERTSFQQHAPVPSW
ncbi:uncharacterized protein [Anabrus simplex]|uniref:uncharacterized protein n=1 Tax=Anabrus simplex TaxID=316456 RepID=UPI0035A3BECF